MTRHPSKRNPSTDMEGSDASTSARSAFEDFFPPGVAVAVWDGEERPALLPVEEAAIRRATPGRRDEFSRGRATARRALSTFGVDSPGIGVGANREPLWPNGFVGSITHCTGLIAAVAGRATHLAALGIDAEPERALPGETRDLILVESERAHDPILETVVFSAKESIHKAVFPVSGIWMDFLDVVVRLDATGSFTAAPAPGRGPLPPQVTALRGHFSRVAGFILTGCYLPAGVGAGHPLSDGPSP